jgi:hypothetical protein
MTLILRKDADADGNMFYFADIYQNPADACLKRDKIETIQFISMGISDEVYDDIVPPGRKVFIIND